MKTATSLFFTSTFLIILLGSAPSVMAADAKTLPGSTCQTRYASDAQYVYRSGGSIANMSTQKPVWVECPIIKDVNAWVGALRNVSVWVMDSNPDTLSKDVKCFVSEHWNRSNAWSDSVTRSDSTWGATSSPEELKFNFNLGGLYPMRQYYILRCSIPPLYNGRRSAVLSYQASEM